MEKQNRFIEPGTPQPETQYHIEILPDGPYLVYGNPPLQQEILVPDDEDIPWDYQKGTEYATDEQPTSLCRCGHSHKHPYCDGSHREADWDPTLTADNIPLLENAESYDGPTVELADNPDYCAHARICMAKGTAWRNTRHSDHAEARIIAIHESMLCPAGRLKLWDKAEEKFSEPPFMPALGLIEDPQQKCSGPLWVMGGIPINSPDTAYEQRNRVTLCRCGSSANKPFCDGAHLETKFNDHLPLPEEPAKQEEAPHT